MSQYFTSYNPKHRVRFYRGDTGEDVFEVMRDNVDVDNISDDLISLVTNKAYGRAAGTWQMTLTCKVVPNVLGVMNTYDEHIMPDDIVTIELDAGGGDGMKVVMVGLVDRTSVVWQGGAIPQRQVKITGQDLGKLLLKHDVGWDVVKFNYLQTADSGDSDAIKINAQLSRQFDPTLTVMTAKNLIERLFQQTFKDMLPTWAPFFDIDTTGTTDDWILWNPAIVNLQGCSVWAALTHCMHEPFNVLTTETRGLKDFVVTLEAQPIDDFGRLIRNPDRQHTIYDTDIISDDVGISDNERINFLFYSPQFYLTSADMPVPVAMAHPDLIEYIDSSIEKHGYCAKTFKDDFVPPIVKWHAPLVLPSNSEWLLSAREAKSRLWSWYKLNHTYRSGMFQIHLRPEIKAGDELRRYFADDKIIQYQIEQVSHHYTVWPQLQFVTTLHVTRGQLL